ncbi:hypothetical protein [Streptomyces sp. LN325]|uniref:hypothetical protein n=1 Tax=Streptomyces sp. LN325 TaxID=3112976 RepID=UPI003715BE21
MSTKRVRRARHPGRTRAHRAGRRRARSARRPAPCRVCHGAQYNREALDVHFKGKSLADVLSTTFGVCPDSSHGLFAERAIVLQHLRTLHHVGPGYGKPGRPATTLPVLDEPATVCTTTTYATQPQSRAGQFLRPLPDRS